MSLERASEKLRFQLDVFCDLARFQNLLPENDRERYETLLRRAIDIADDVHKIVIRA